MAHFDMSSGAITVNGKTSLPNVRTTCICCGSVAYSELWNQSKNVFPKDDWFPVQSSGHILVPTTKLPFTFVPDGPPFPSICSLNILSNIYLIYSNSMSNSFPVFQEVPLSSNCLVVSSMSSP